MHVNTSATGPFRTYDLLLVVVRRTPTWFMCNFRSGRTYDAGNWKAGESISTRQPKLHCRMSTSLYSVIVSFVTEAAGNWWITEPPLSVIATGFGSTERGASNPLSACGSPAPTVTRA